MRRKDSSAGGAQIQDSPVLTGAILDGAG